MDVPLQLNTGDAFVPPEPVATNHNNKPVKYTVDTSQVDINQPGQYNVIYTAIDLIGRQTQITKVLTVSQSNISYTTGLPAAGLPTAPVPSEFSTPEAMITAIEASSQTARSALIGSQGITTGLFAPFIGNRGTLEQVSDITTIPGIASNITTVDITSAPVNKIVAGDENLNNRAAGNFRPQLTSPFVPEFTSTPYSWDQLNTTNDISGKYIHHTVIVLDSSHVLVFVSGQNKTKLYIDHNSSGVIKKTGNKLEITIPANVTAAEMIYMVSRQRHYRLAGNDWEYFILKVS
jgi:hypothetical protein